MPNFMVHLAVAKLYAQKHDIQGNDARDFYDGNVAPDLEEKKIDGKRTQHLYKPLAPDPTDEERCRNDIDFEEHFQRNEYGNSLTEKGKLLHLIVDNYCYTNALDMGRLVREINAGVKRRVILSNSFDSINDYLKNKYDLNYNMTNKEKEMGEKLEEWQALDSQSTANLFDTPEAIEKLDSFIEKIANEIDLDKCIAERRVFIADYDKATNAEITSFHLSQ